MLLKQSSTISIFLILLFLSSLFTVITYSFFPFIYEFLIPFHFLRYQIIILIGLSLLIASLIWIWIAQTQMGMSWRVGIDEQTKTELITTGIFSISINPIFFGMEVNLVGFFLVIPNVISLLVLIAGIVLINFQISLEEHYLRTIHRNNYENYCKNVRRWL